jgi:iron(III) transport system substrate-binding protein
MLKQILKAFLPLAALIALPLLLRKDTVEATPTAKDADKLVIITPHTQTIRSEFENKFKLHYKKQTGREIEFDWRNPGGTADIVRLINDRFQAEFRRYWLSNPKNGAWTNEVMQSFDNRRSDPNTCKSRKVFLDSNVGIGIDIFFGGGMYDLTKQAKMGHAVDAGIQKLHPAWFTNKIIPQQWHGETFYDKKGRLYGTCLTEFGLCYNLDRLKELADPTPPIRWSNLGEGRFYNKIAVADPTKSGSINKCFEMLIQQQMGNAVKRLGPEKGKVTGWANAINLIKRIGANTRYLTDSASKVPRDVARGDAMAGMCIDFYGRSEAEYTAFESQGKERMKFVAPIGGTSISADPIQLLRGAPNRSVAIAFIEFVLSKKGQKLWDNRVGTPGGPIKFALRRLPIRRDMYTKADQTNMSDPDIDPFNPKEPLVYHGGWTGPYFGLIRVLIKCAIINPRDELRRAWKAILDAGGPEAVPEAMKAFNALPFSYAEIKDARNQLNPAAKGNSVIKTLQTRRKWGEFFRKQYLKAELLASSSLTRAGRTLDAGETPAVPGEATRARRPLGAGETPAVPGKEQVND